MVFKKTHIGALLISASLFFFARTASAQVMFNEIQISPIGERFIELYNSGNTDVELTGWYIQRKTATGNSFSSLVTSTQLNGKIIKPNGYFLVSRSTSGNPDITVDNLTLTESNTVRIRDSKGVDIDQVGWTTIDEGKSYQRVSASEWIIAAPTPGTGASGTSPQTAVISQESNSSESALTSSSNISNFPVEPQIIAYAGTTTRITVAGAPIVFSGKVFGLKKEPIENARMVWSFGDGARGEGQSVSHIYYYPGEYIVVLDAASGFYSASARVRVVVNIPKLALRAGGNGIHSFVSVENQSDSEADLSGWRISAQDKNFTFPQSTILGARKTVSFASEVTGLATSFSISPSLYFPNGTLVELYNEKILSLTATFIPSKKSSEKIISKQSVSVSPRINSSQTSGQMASALNTLPDSFVHSNALASPKEGRWWLWYAGIGFLGALAFLGFRLSRAGTKADIADEFEIIEEIEEKGKEGEGARPQNTLPF